MAFQALAADNQKRFADAYREAHLAKNTEAFLALVEISPDTPEWIRAQIVETFESDSELTIKEIAFEPLGEDFSMSFEYEGVTYVPTLEPMMSMAISFDEAGQGRAMITGTTYIIGEKEGALRIVTAKPAGE